MAYDDLLIQIVDEDDKPVRGASIDEAQQQGLIHRIARVMIEDSEGNVLLQKRRENKRTYPGCWDNSAAGHVDEGETYETAATRELAEEMGITGFPLEEVSYYRTNRSFQGRKLNRFNKIYKAVIPAHTSITIEPEEVAEAKWLTQDGR